jgi:CHRD domain
MRKFSVLGALILFLATLTVAFAQTASSSVQMNATEGNNVRGTATITQSGNGVTVSVRLSGYNANQGSIGHIHSGRCETGGPVVFPLTTLQADAQGNGTADSTLATAPYATVANGNHYVQYHENTTPPGGGRPVSCGNIAAAGQGGGGSVPGSPPASGVGGLDNQAGISAWFLLPLLGLMVLAGALYGAKRQRKTK